ncbi:uncharacterized protein SPSK_03659 [Sporothrix schenckii 1099-18]|uniref:Uncharacterized protein n=1 Tax=Sporothrix schenckii 1099-18 TaxID=1397361 RepID=A0A0F2LY58_SPOSC|nr:uncharacterized protein SPSK_03659 [Sporothrix schenckii 1099-18]KJR82407.1 hypothetical protein SPSK_03659 [Sporothrix schenckii 1099-18]
MGPIGPTFDAIQCTLNAARTSEIGRIGLGSCKSGGVASDGLGLLKTLNIAARRADVVDSLLDDIFCLLFCSVTCRVVSLFVCLLILAIFLLRRRLNECAQCLYAINMLRVGRQCGQVCRQRIMKLACHVVGLLHERQVLEAEEARHCTVDDCDTLSGPQRGDHAGFERLEDRRLDTLECITRNSDSERE